MHFRNLAGLPYREIWSGFVFNGEKVGFTHLKIEPLQGKTLFRITSEAHMQIRFLGLEKEVHMRSRDLVRSDLTLLSFSFEQKMGDRPLSLEGKFVDRKLRIVQRSGGETKKLEIALHGPIYPVSAINLLPLLRGLRIGATYGYQVFDPQVQAVVKVSQAVASFERSRKLLLEPSFKLKTRMHNQQVFSWINLRGETVLEMAMAGTLITYKEREEVARRYLSEASMNKKDLILDFSLVPIKSPIPCPRNATYLDISLEGIPGELPLLKGPGQGVVGRRLNGKSEAVYRLRSGLKKYRSGDKGASYRGRLRKYLTPSAHIESNHPEIKRTAERVLSEAWTPLERLQALAGWVSEEVKDEVVDSVSALEVLHRKKGECQAHTLLYTALARAAGIPTRLVGGLVYIQGMGFLYHAWAESYLDSWIAVDPTFNQVGVDATHIKLVEGESWLALMELGKVIGKVKAKVIGYRTSCHGSGVAR